MLIHHLLGDAFRVAVLLAMVLLAIPALRRASAATRRLLLAVSLGGALALPLVSAAVPTWRVQTPAVVESLRTVVVTEPMVPASTPAALGTSESAALPRVEPARRFDPTGLVAYVWAAGAAIVLARLLVGIAKTRRIVRRATAAPAWSLAAARAGATTGQRVDVRSTDEIDAPAVAGVLAPVILVPHASTRWTDDRRYAVLLHELGHVRQKDCLVQVIAQLACAAHWFNPLVWLASRRLRIERELAADDAVVAAGAQASSYAEDLLAVASAADAERDVPAGALGMAERSLLATRVTAIISARRLRRPPTPAGTAVLVAGVGAGVVALACASPENAKATKADHIAATAAPVSTVAGSTLDPRLQSIAEEELGHAMEEWKASAGTVLVLDPWTGEILANAGRAHGARVDVATRSAFVPGSTMKAFTLAAALEERLVTSADRFDCEHGAWTYRGETIRDHVASGSLTLAEMTAVSSNIGFGKIYDRLGDVRLDRWLRVFHFGTAPAIEGAGAGSLPALREGSAAGVWLATGEGMTASPLQVAAAYAVLANGGFYVAPTLSRRTGEAAHERVVSPDTAHTVVAMLEHVVSDERATGTAARVDGQHVAGKTGTAATELPDGSESVYASFVGIIPSTAPRFVILVGLEQPQGDAPYGGYVAAPVFSRVATRALAP
jgi:beta-lactamase regulating signal transducer with metallopeptidase domain